MNKLIYMISKENLEKLELSHLESLHSKKDRPFTKGMRYAEERVKRAYTKSCHGDWDSVNEIKFLDTLETFYIYQAVLEAILHNLASYEREETL